MRVIEPYQENPAIAVRCVFVWYWIADRFDDPIPCDMIGPTLRSLVHNR